MRRLASPSRLLTATALCAQLFARQAAEPICIEHLAAAGDRLPAIASTPAPGSLRVVSGGVLRALVDAAQPGGTPSLGLQRAVASRLAAAAASSGELLVLAQILATGPCALPLVACNVATADGKLVLPSHVVRESGGRRIAFVGLTAAARGVELPDGWQLVEPVRALNAALQAARAEAPHVVLLSTLGLGEVRALLPLVPGIDLVIAPGSRGGDSQPSRVFDTWLCPTARNGQALASLTVRAGAGNRLEAEGQRFRQALLDAAEQRALAELCALRAEPTPVPPPDLGPPSPPPLGLAGHGIDPIAVNRAIDRGGRALWAYVTERDLQRPEASFGDDDTHWLVALALVHAGAHRKSSTIDAAIRGALASAEPRQRSTYVAGLVAMLVEDLGDSRYLPQLREAARFLVETQGAGGSWSYGVKLPDEIFGEVDPTMPLVVNGGRALDDPSGTTERLSRLTSWELAWNGDNSASQFALLGLRSAARLGIRSPDETWRRALRSYCGYQAKGGGWAYCSGDDGSAYGSMTLAGISALAICRHELGLRDPGVDARLARGMRWMAERFAVDKNPGSAIYHGYYLYSLERTGRILGTEHFGQHEWYPLGCRQLLATQDAKGLWSLGQGEIDPRLATSYALLFLTRATATLSLTIERGGKGKLRADVALPRRERVYFVLDASGSMLEALGGRGESRSKFDAARDAMSRTVGLLAPGARIALRAYGHRRRAVEPGADADTELVLPPQPLDHDAFGRRLTALRARGRTPLARSLEEAALDLKPIAREDAPTVVVLLSDGGEDTQPRRDPVAAAAALAALPGVSLHVVGFDIGRADWRAQLEAIARKGKGRFLCASRDGDLARTVREAFLSCPESYTIHDLKGRQLAQAAFGQEVELDEGKYLFRTRHDGKDHQCVVWVNTNRTSSVSFDGARLRSR